MVLEAVKLVHNAIGNVLGDPLGHLAAVPPLQEMMMLLPASPEASLRQALKMPMQLAVIHQSRYGPTLSQASKP